MTVTRNKEGFETRLSPLGTRPPVVRCQVTMSGRVDEGWWSPVPAVGHPQKREEPYLRRDRRRTYTDQNKNGTRYEQKSTVIPGYPLCLGSLQVPDDHQRYTSRAQDGRPGQNLRDVHTRKLSADAHSVFEVN